MTIPPSVGPAATVDFEDLAIAAGSFENGAGLSGDPLVSRGVSLNNSYSYIEGWGGIWSGWSGSRVTDTSVHDFTNQYGAIAGGGKDSPAYGVGFLNYYASPPVVPTVTLPAETAVLGVYLTNTTYAYYTMKDGNAFSRRFGQRLGDGGIVLSETDAPDWFKLTITGKDGGGAVSGSVDFYLADYRLADDAQDYLVDDWRWVDLSGLGDRVKSLEFSLDSSDSDPVFGMNTPAYFAMDNLTTAPVPEPSTLALATAAAVAGGLWFMRCRRGGPKHVGESSR